MPRGDKEQILRYEMPTLSCSEESIGTFFLSGDVSSLPEDGNSSTGKGRLLLSGIRSGCLCGGCTGAADGDAGSSASYGGEGAAYYG